MTMANSLWRIRSSRIDGIRAPVTKVVRCTIILSHSKGCTLHDEEELLRIRFARIRSPMTKGKGTHAKKEGSRIARMNGRR